MGMLDLPDIPHSLLPHMVSTSCRILGSLGHVLLSFRLGRIVLFDGVCLLLVGLRLSCSHCLVFLENGEGLVVVTMGGGLDLFTMSNIGFGFFLLQRSSIHSLSRRLLGLLSTFLGLLGLLGLLALGSLHLHQGVEEL